MYSKFFNLYSAKYYTFYIYYIIELIYKKNIDLFSFVISLEDIDDYSLSI